MSCLLTVFRFLRPGSGSPFAKKNALGSFVGVREQGCRWAESASQAVLIRVDKPSISKIRACEVLAVYWFAVGELGRAAIHASKPSSILYRSEHHLC